MLTMSAPTAIPSPRSADVSLRGLLRQLAALLPDAGVSDGLATAPAIEAFSTADDLPQLASTRLIEPGSLRAHAVPAGNTVPFSAFLDGKQQSRVFQYVARGVPIVYGTVGAAIRMRRDRRLTTWRHRVESRLYVAKRLLPAAWNDALAGLDIAIVDTSAPSDAQPSLEHPYAISDAAIHRVQRDRELTEHRLGEEWLASVNEPLFVDGGISGNDRLARSDSVVGVVKTHRTLYAQGDGLDAVFGLRAGERSSVFEVGSRERSLVASWYLRLRDPVGHDPMWGLVRVEVNYSQMDTNSVSLRADDVSRRILAEVSPVALPDSRWDRMVYGIRDCEEFLRSVM